MSVECAFGSCEEMSLSRGGSSLFSCGWSEAQSEIRSLKEDWESTRSTFIESESSLSPASRDELKLGALVNGVLDLLSETDSGGNSASSEISRNFIKLASFRSRTK